MVERIHTSGSAFSLPGMLAGAAENGNGGNGRRRSRAFSIESASDYGGEDGYRPERYQDDVVGYGALHHGQTGTKQRGHQYQPANTTSPQHSPQTQQRYYSTSHAERANYLPPGAAMPMLASKTPSQRYMPVQQHSHTSSFGQESDPASAESANPFYDSTPPSSADNDHLNRNLSTSTRATTVLPYDLGAGTSKAPNVHTPGSPSQKEFLLTPRVEAAVDPFQDAELAPMPKSPVLAPTPLERRRTIDPFSQKQTLRVVNPEAGGLSAASSVRTPASSVWSQGEEDDEDFYYHSSQAARDAKTGSMDSRSASPLPPHLGPNRQKLSVLNRDSASSVHTPNEIDTIGFFS